MLLDPGAQFWEGMNLIGMRIGGVQQTLGTPSKFPTGDSRKTQEMECAVNR